MKIFYFVNGQFTESSRARLPLNDLGLLRGYGIFDYFRTYGKKPFCLNAHWERFRASTEAMNLRLPCNREKFKTIIAKLIVKNGHLKNLGFRTVLTGGSTKDYRTASRPNFFIIVDESRHYPEKIYQNGAKIITLTHRRPTPEIKTLNYSAAISHWQKVIKEQAAEILYVFQGDVSEGATSNFFIVKNRVLLTPGKSVLAGITRQIVIQLAKTERIKIKFVSLKLKDVLNADECFITATDKEIMPVVKIDEWTIGSGRPGEQTKKLIELFGKFKSCQSEICVQNL